MASIEHVVLEVADPATSGPFYDALGLGDRVRLRPGDEPTSGFRGFTLSPVVPQPSAVDALVAAGVDAGGTVLKPAKKSLWGYGGVVQAPDGTVVTLASASKKETGPASTSIDSVVLQLGAEDVAASRRFYEDHGLTVTTSHGRSYVEFDLPRSPVSLALLKRRALAKASGVPAEGSGSHRLVVAGSIGDAVDPDGFAWQTA